MRKKGSHHFFSRAEAKCLLVMLAITVLVLVWSYIFFAIINKNDWNWIVDAVADVENKDDSIELIATLSTVIGLAGCLGAIIYYNITAWTIPLLSRCFDNLFGWLPFVGRSNHIKPAEDKNFFSTSYERELEREREREEDEKYERMERRIAGHSWYKHTNVFGEVKDICIDNYSSPSFLGKIIGFLFGIIFALLKAIIILIGYILSIIGIPVCSPIIIFLGLAIISLIVQNNFLYMMYIGIALVIIFVLLYIVVPIVSFKSRKK